MQVLDQQAIVKISFDVPQPSTSTVPVQKPSATTFPFEMGASFVTGVDGALVSNFLARYVEIQLIGREKYTYIPAVSSMFSMLKEPLSPMHMIPPLLSHSQPTPTYPIVVKRKATNIRYPISMI